MNWIKIRTDLHEDTAVLEMSDILSDTCPTYAGHAPDMRRTQVAEVVGLVVRFWSWLDRNTATGEGIRASERHIDMLVGRTGFAAAMRQVGWLSGEDGALQVPHYDRHNGASAKARALEAEAKKLRRSVAEKCPTNSAENVGPEKRREEKKSVPPLWAVDKDLAKAKADLSLFDSTETHFYWPPPDRHKTLKSKYTAKRAALTSRIAELEALRLTARP